MNDKKTISFKNAIIASILMILVFSYLKFMNHGKDVEPLKPFSTFPKQIGLWKGTEHFFSDEIYNFVGVDDSALINYSNPPENEIQLYIGYYKSQRKGDMIHSPKNCMPGSGWEITSTTYENIETKDGETIRIIKLILEKGAEKQIVFYWFHGRGRIVDSEYKQKIYLVIDSIFKNRTDDSFIRIISPVNNNQIDNTLKSMKEFTKDLMTILEQYIPE